MISIRFTAPVVFAAAATVVAASPVGAAPTGVGGSAADVVQQLSDAGYSVQLNGAVEEPLSRCTATAVHGLLNTDPVQDPPR